jgi:hypothetical protein
MKLPVLDNWSVRSDAPGPYEAPETKGIQVSGNVFFSPKLKDGERVTTSYVVAISGLEISTSNGSIYRLGMPDEGYMEWCREHDCHIPTPEEPIKLHT